MPRTRDEPHKPLDLPVPGGHRYTCAICDATVSIPTVLLVQWNHEGKLMERIQAELTRVVLLRTGHYGGPLRQPDKMTPPHLDVIALYAAIDAERTARLLDWKDVAEQARVPASTLTRMGQGKKPSADNLAALVWWAGLDVRDYFTACDEPVAQSNDGEEQ